MNGQQTAKKPVLGIGSALVDILINLPNDSLLAKFDLPKGSMTLIDAQLAEQMFCAASGLNHHLETGGSAANTIRAIAEMGWPCGFIGKIGNDDLGRFFNNEFEKRGIQTHLFKSENPTGKATTLISPDSERTFGTYLGAASELSASEMTTALFAQYAILHLEGYLVFNHELIEGVLQLAKNAGLLVSLDMASFNVVEANRDFLDYLLRKYVDIVFANEEEAKSFTGHEPEAALKQLASICHIAIVKIGKSGSLVQSAEEFYKIPPILAKPIDTTGAGDLYASGFLFGMANGFNLETCGKLGSLLAGKVVEELGANIKTAGWEAIRKQVPQITNG